MIPDVSEAFHSKWILGEISQLWFNHIIFVLLILSLEWLCSFSVLLILTAVKQKLMSSLFSG